MKPEFIIEFGTDRTAEVVDVALSSDHYLSVIVVYDDNKWASEVTLHND